MEQRESGTDESERFKEEEKDDSSGEDNPSSDVASLSCLPSFDYSERPPPYLEIEEIPSHRWLESHSSFARSEPDEISPRKSASSTSPSVASTSSYTSKRRKNPPSLRWNWWSSPAVRKERNASLTSLQEDTRLSDFLTGIHQFTFKEIRTATNDFHNLIGEGGFANTFKGFLPPHNQIAVKLFKSKSEHEFRLQNVYTNEVHVSSRLRHRNITSFLGHCKHKDKFMLIYEYQPNGCLHRLLFSGGEGETLLNWRIRYKICLQTANGLAYLHKERIIHRDIKPSNILLDADFVPKISGFSLAKRMNENVSHLSTRIVGTMGYVAPEYLATGDLTDETYVFSYGVVILNIVSGKRAISTERQYLVDKLHETLKEQGNLLEFVDPRLDSYDEEEALTLLKLSALCTKNSSTLRPSIHTVVSVLEGKLKVEEFIHDRWLDGYEQDSQCFSEEEMDDIETNDDVCTAPPTSEVNTMIPSKENGVMQQTPPSLTSTTGDATLESIKNTSVDYDCFHHHTDDIDTLFLAIDSTRIPDGTNELGETSSSSFPTVEVPETFDELKTLVLSSTLKEALNDETKSKILHLCEVLEDSILSNSQSSLVHHVKYILSFTSDLSVAEIEDTLYVKKYQSAQLKVEETKEKAKGLRHEATTLRTSKTSTENHINLIKDKITKHEEELAKLHHELNALKIQHVDDEKKLEEIHKVVASDVREITQLAKWLGEESGKKVSTEVRLKHIRECFHQEQEDWKRIQVRFW